MIYTTSKRIRKSYIFFLTKTTVRRIISSLYGCLRGALQSHTPPAKEPLGREGLAILALRKLNRQPYFLSLYCHGTAGRAWQRSIEFTTVYHTTPRLHGCITRSRHAALPGQVGTACAERHGQVCLPTRQDPSGGTAVAIYRQSDG